MAADKAILTIGDKEVELPILQGTAGNDVIDIRTLGSTGYFTYDPGFLATGSCDSSITFIDGAEGVLLHRGFPIGELAGKSDYLEVCYMLLHGDAPTSEQYDEFKSTITRHTMVHEQIGKFFHGFLNDSHPMAMLCGTVGALSSFYHDDLDVSCPEQRVRSAHRLIAKMPTLIAMAYKYSIGQPFVYPRNDLSYAANFLNMMFSVPAEDYKIRRLNVLWIASLFCTQITNKMHQRLLFVLLALQVQTHMHVLLQVLLRFGVLLTVVLMKRV